MMKTIFTCFILIASSNCLAQKTIEEYKKSPDQDILSEMDIAVFGKLNCTSYMAKTPRDSVKYSYEGKYTDSKKIVLEDIECIIFFYVYYSKELNYEFKFFRGVDRQGKIMASESTLKKIFPDCILRNQVCKLISKDSAIGIAQRNNIKYPYNLYVTLEKPKNSNDFFWVIDSQDTTYVNYNEPPHDGLDHPIMPWKEPNTRIINAATGQLIHLREYYVLDK